jgi:hypothetical protein
MNLMPPKARALLYSCQGANQGICKIADTENGDKLVNYTWPDYQEARAAMFGAESFNPAKPPERRNRRSAASEVAVREARR